MHSTRPVFANFSAKPDSTLLRNASRAGAVVGVDTGMLPSGPSPTYSRAAGSTARQFECAGMSQSPAIFDAQFTAPACWQAGWIQSIAAHAVAGLQAGLPSGCPAFRPDYNRVLRPVKPLGLTVIGPPGPIARLSVRPSGWTITQVLGPWRRGVAASQRCRRR